jgi:hypothetical protein
MADSRSFSALSQKSKTHVQNRQKALKQWRQQRKEKKKQPLGLAPEAPGLLETSDPGLDLDVTEQPTIIPPESNVATAQQPQGENVSQPGYQGPPKPSAEATPWYTPFEPTVGTSGYTGASGTFTGPTGAQIEATPANIEAARTIPFDTKTGTLHGDISVSTPQVQAPDTSTPNPTPLTGGHILSGEQLNPLTAAKPSLLADTGNIRAVQSQQDQQAGRLESQAGVMGAAENYRNAKTPEAQAAAMQDYRNALMEKQAFGDLMTSGEQSENQKRVMEKAREGVENDPGVQKYRAYLRDKGISPFEVGTLGSWIEKSGKMSRLTEPQLNAAHSQAEQDSRISAGLRTRAAAAKQSYKDSGDERWLAEADRLISEAQAAEELSGGRDPANPTAGFNVDNARRVARERMADYPTLKRSVDQGLAPREALDQARADTQKLEKIRRENATEKEGIEAEKKTAKGGEGAGNLPEVQGRRQETANPQEEPPKKGKLTKEEEEDARLRRMAGNQRARNFLGLPQYSRRLAAPSYYA